MCPVLPDYSCDYDQPAPSYSLEVLDGEHRLEYTPPTARRPIPTGTFTKANRRVSLILTDQEEGVDFPTYGRNATIRGEVFLKDRENIDNVTVKVIVRLIMLEYLFPYLYTG